MPDLTELTLSRVEQVLDGALGPDAAHGTGEGTAADVALVVAQRDRLELMLDRRDERLDAVRHHVDRLEAWCRDATRDDGQALGGIVADLRRAVDGGPDDG